MTKNLLGTAAVLLALSAFTPAAASGLEISPMHRGLAAHDTATATYSVAGLRVIHRPLAVNELVAVNLYLLGGARQVDASTAGIEPLLIRASERGTAGYPGRETRMALARTGSRMVLSVQPDWTLFGFRGLRTEFDSTWAVFADRVVRPTLDSASVEFARARMLRDLRNASSHPDVIARRLADSLAFAGHPYANDPGGTEASLRRIDVAELREYHRSQMITSRMLLVVVGNVTRAQVEAAIGRTFASLPTGDYTWMLPPTWSAAKSALVVDQRRVPTNYIRGYFGGPQSTSRDYAAFRIATSLLGGFAFSHIRDGGISYAAGSLFMERGASGGGVYVSTVRPDTAVKIFNTAIRTLRDLDIDQATLRRYYQGYVTDYYAENESNAGQADYIARYELLRGDWRKGEEWLEELRTVRSIHIRAAANRYLKNVQYVYVGNPGLVPQREMTRY